MLMKVFDAVIARYAKTAPSSACLMGIDLAARAPNQCSNVSLAHSGFDKGRR